MPDGKDWMAVAYKYSQKSIGRAKLAWNNSAEQRDDEIFYVFNTGFLNVNREEMSHNLDLLDRVVTSQGTESLRSGVTGETIEINYKNLFFNPPQDLKAFLPNRFEKNATITREIAVAGKKPQKVTYRNYSQGKATGWNTEAFQSYFPGVKEGQDVEKTLRVLSHAGGNWLSL
jgi:hypothetical protein